MARDVVIISVRAEVQAFLERIAVLETHAEGPASFWRGRLAGRDVWLASCLMGKVNAAMTAQAAVERFRPAAILICGSAGGLAPEIQPGDLVISTHAAQHDAGMNWGDRFVTLGVQFHHNGRIGLRRRFPADPSLLAAAQEAAVFLRHDDPGKPPKVHAGLIVTGDQAVFSRQRRQAILETWHALAVDMETAAVAQVAATHGIPWLAIRGISDSAGEEAGFDPSLLSSSLDDTGLGAWLSLQGRRLHWLLRRPDTPWRIFRLLQGTRLAVTRAVMLTEAVLSRWSE
ncbi:MAG: 5'-methylthioadenosine/S-adenosylhomocysteine nucleosidase [Anaerolineae bacterium]